MLEGKDLEQAIANYKSRYKKEPYQPLSTFLLKLKSCIFNSSRSMESTSQQSNSHQMENTQHSKPIVSVQ